MYKEPRPLKEIHAIQEKIYEEMKGLSKSKKIEAIRKETDETKKMYNINLRNVSKASKIS